MLSVADNELLTATGPGTPSGELFRRYWQPVALSEEIPPGGAPKAIKILGEPLVLFRDDQGKVGLLDLHCSHRGADLSLVPPSMKLLPKSEALGASSPGPFGIPQSHLQLFPPCPSCNESRKQRSDGR